MIRCRNAGFGAPWHLKDIVVEDVKQKRKFIFKCERWLSLSDDDRKLVRELKAETPPGQQRQQRSFGDADNYGPPRDRLATTDPYARDRLVPEGRERDRLGQTEPLGFGPSPDAMTELKLEFYTNNTREGKMLHNLWIQFEGERGPSKIYLIANSDTNPMFVDSEMDRVRVNRVSIKSKSLGRLLAVRMQGVQREGVELAITRWDLLKMTVNDTLVGQKCAPLLCVLYPFNSRSVPTDLFSYSLQSSEALLCFSLIADTKYIVVLCTVIVDIVCSKDTSSWRASRSAWRLNTRSV